MRERVRERERERERSEERGKEKEGRYMASPSRVDQYSLLFLFFVFILHRYTRAPCKCVQGHK